MHATSYSESSGLKNIHYQFPFNVSSTFGTSLRKVEIRLGGQNQCLGLDGRHRFLKIAIVWLLQGDIAILPSLGHD